MIFMSNNCFTCTTDNMSMTNNTGSITEEGPHLSDCEDSSIHTEDKGECVNTVGDNQYDGFHSNFVAPARYDKTLLSPLTANECTTQDSPKRVEELIDVTTHNSPPEDSKDVLAPTRSKESIYIDDGRSQSESNVCKGDAKPKRMTMVCKICISRLVLFCKYSTTIRPFKLRFLV